VVGVLQSIWRPATQQLACKPPCPSHRASQALVHSQVGARSPVQHARYQAVRRPASALLQGASLHGESAARRQAITELLFFASVGDLARCKKITSTWSIEVRLQQQCADGEQGAQSVFPRAEQKQGA
jgi:hypothetical protein